MNDKPAMANTQAFAVITQDELSSLRAELAELRAQVSAQNDRLAHIAEYWNGERNDQAMYDALCHIVDEAGSALPVPPAAVPDVFIEHSVMRPPVKTAAVPDDVAKDASLSGKEFDALLILLMCSDPWPVGDEENEKTVKAMATRIAKLHGHDDWVDAYHSHAPTDAAAILAADTEGRKDE